MNKKYIYDIVNAIEHNATLLGEDPQKRYADNPQIRKTIVKQCEILRKELGLEDTN